jgi:hypothetical protein
MTNEQLEKFLQKDIANSATVKINFKTRSAILGIFLKLEDYTELKSKNLWRIVSESRIDEFKKTKNAGLARIFNGVEITRLEKV